MKKKNMLIFLQAKSSTLSFKFFDLDCGMTLGFQQE